MKTNVSAALEQFKAAIAAAGGLRSVRFGSVLHVYSASLEGAKLEELRKRAVRNGAGICFPDGSREWYEWETEWNSAKGQMRESEGYTWHPDGKRVRGTIFANRVDKNGNHSRTAVRKAWKDYLGVAK